MIAGLKPYSGYKNSGLPWLGSIPAHWNLRRAKYLYREIDERSATGDEELLSVSHLTGVTPRREKNVTMFLAESNVGHKLCQPGDLVINTMWAWMGALGVARQFGLVSPSYGVYRPLDLDDHSLAYLDRLLRTPAYVSEYTCRSTGVNSSRLRLYPDEFLRIPILSPPETERSAVVCYLDYVDRRIRRYIRAKQKLIKLLEEQKRAIIHQAVTGQIDVRTGNPYPAYKDSGVEWLGQVPDHWQVRRLRNVVGMLVSNVDKYTNEGQQDVRLCNYVDVYKNDRITGDIAFMKATASAEEVGRFNVFVGDVLITKDSESWNDIGVPAVVEWSAPDLVCGYHLAILRPRPALLRSGFLFRGLQSTGIATQLHVAANGVTRYGLAQDAIKSIRIPLPPISEQVTIARHIDDSLEDVNAAIGHTKREIELLREYRTRLIADVVTGKLDVREAAANLPEETEEPELLEDENLIADESEANGIVDEEAVLAEVKV